MEMKFLWHIVCHITFFDGRQLMGIFIMRVGAGCYGGEGVGGLGKTGGEDEGMK